MKEYKKPTLSDHKRAIEYANKKCDERMDEELRTQICDVLDSAILEVPECKDQADYHKNLNFYTDKIFAMLSKRDNYIKTLVKVISEKDKIIDAIYSQDKKELENER